MKLLAIGRPRPGLDVWREIGAQAAAEMRALWELYTAGPGREMYSPGGLGAVLVLEAAGTGDAAAALDGMPLVKVGVIEFEVLGLYPFTPLAMAFEGKEGT